ncbi:hypothetical protein DFQ30_003912 [Apophysomyces sp. BC1015]|nr:hypothetical protein DFQ30_003912 [Apophysomyces sp. BC1015]
MEIQLESLTDQLQLYKYDALKLAMCNKLINASLKLFDTMVTVADHNMEDQDRTLQIKLVEERHFRGAVQIKLDQSEELITAKEKIAEENIEHLQSSATKYAQKYDKLNNMYDSVRAELKNNTHKALKSKEDTEHRRLSETLDLRIKLDQSKDKITNLEMREKNLLMENKSLQLNVAELKMRSQDFCHQQDLIEELKEQNETYKMKIRAGKRQIKTLEVERMEEKDWNRRQSGAIQAERETLRKYIQRLREHVLLTDHSIYATLPQSRTQYASNVILSTANISTGAQNTTNEEQSPASPPKKPTLKRKASRKTTIQETTAISSRKRKGRLSVERGSLQVEDVSGHAPLSSTCQVSDGSTPLQQRPCLDDQEEEKISEEFTALKEYHPTTAELLHQTAATGVNVSKKKSAKDDAAGLADIVHQLKSQIDRLEKVLEQRSMVIDPWAADVPQAYASLLSKLPSTFLQRLDDNDPLDTAYAHWSALLQCLPLMDADSQIHVRTIALYAMRQLSESKQKCGSPMKSSLSCLNLQDHVNDTTRKRADGWLPPSFESYTTPKDHYEDHYPQPSASVSTPIVQEKPKLRGWFKGNKVVPLQLSSSSTTMGKSKLKFWLKPTI